MALSQQAFQSWGYSASQAAQKLAMGAEPGGQVSTCANRKYAVPG
jgi:hypothetical protein